MLDCVMGVNRQEPPGPSLRKAVVARGHYPGEEVSRGLQFGIRP